MAKLYDLARMTTATVGTGTITLGAAANGSLSFAAAGVRDGDAVSYGIADGANSEVGTGVYTAAGTTLSRNPTRSTNGNAAIPLSGAAQVFITALAQDFRVHAPAGRLTLTSGVPVIAPEVNGSPTTNVSNAGTVYYTPYVGDLVPIFDGVRFTATVFPEISNVLANSAVGNAGPFVGAANAVYDLYVCSDGAGGCTLTRSDYWQQVANVTNTNASPAVFTHVGHGLLAGTVVRLAPIGGGALSPGFTPGQHYYMVNVTADTYQLAATVGGSPINAGGASTCPIQQATEGMGANLNSTAKTARGAANAQVRQNGLLVNQSAIPNGPGALQGTYVGTIATNPTGGLDWIRGGAVPGGQAAIFMVYNHFNKKVCSTSVIDTSAQYGFVGSGTNNFRLANGSAGNTIQQLYGQREEGVTTLYTQRIVTSGAINAGAKFAVAFDCAADGTYPGNVDQQSMQALAVTAAQYVVCGTTGMSHQALPIGVHRWQAVESSDGTNANLFGGNDGIGGTLTSTFMD